MYTEIKEAANFIARYLFHKIPRRKVCLLAEQLSNFLLMRLIEMDWNITDPSCGERCRLFPVMRDSKCQPLLATAANIVGVDPDEIAVHMPDCMILSINPGHVSYRISDNGQIVHIWNGPIDCDDRYCVFPDFVTKPSNNEHRTNMGAANKTVYIGKTDVEKETTVHDYVPLQLRELQGIHNENPELVHQKQKFPKMFEYTPKEQPTYTVEQFALTRFGSHRQRPDHEVMRRIQKQAAFKQIIGGITPPEENGSSILSDGDHSGIERNMGMDTPDLTSGLMSTSANALLSRFKQLVNNGNVNKSPEECLIEALSTFNPKGFNMNMQGAPDNLLGGYDVGQFSMNQDVSSRWADPRWN